MAADQTSPAQQSSVPEEAPPECPDSNEPAEEGETATFSARRKSSKNTRIHFQLVKVVKLNGYQLNPVLKLLAGSPTPTSRFEHSYRNGCGAHLRC